VAGGLTEPALLELLPPPGRLTLDLACGSGELARELRDLGHDVLAVERSRELVRAARHADKRMEVLRADVGRMPMGSGIADLAVCGAFDGLDGALAEIARVLQPGGLLCVALDRPESVEELSRAWEEAGFVLEALREPTLRLVLRLRREP
jgi:ubiquinone/menaquinone biosynthesis C-methylase UbiE